MTTQEFSNMFDTLLNSYNSQGMFGEQAGTSEIVLDEYEKSVLLTQAQDIIVKSYFEGNATGQGFDDSARRQIDFSSLIRVESLTAETSSTFSKYDNRSLIYKNPDDLLYMLNEKLTITSDGKNIHYVIVPINYKEYDRQMSKAYAQPLKKQAWRLFQDGAGNSTVYSEIIPIEGKAKSGTVKYNVRYVRRPSPIVLVNLEFTDQEQLSIDGVSEVAECELNPIIHMDILNTAVQLAIAAKGGNSQSAQQQRQQQ